MSARVVDCDSYYKYSVLYHLEGLPPACLLHGRDDELVPFNQSILLSAEMTVRGMPHESYAYDGLQHYFSTYKTQPNELSEVVVGNPYNAAHAKKVITTAIEDYIKAFS